MAPIKHAAAKARKESAIRLQHWVDQAQKRQIAAEVATLRETLRADAPDDLPPRPGTTAYLVLVLRPEGPTGDRYRLSASRHPGIGPHWAPLPIGDVVGSLDRNRNNVATLVTQAERDWGWYEPDIRIEFVLDRGNINLAVDQWPADNDERVPEPLGSRYPTVIRSLERNSDDKYLRFWRRRWSVPAGQARTCRPVDRDASFRARDAARTASASCGRCSAGGTTWCRRCSADHRSRTSNPRTRSWPPSTRACP